MNDGTIEQNEELALTYDFSDEDLGKAGASADAPGMASFYSSFVPAGCTCVSGV